MAVHLSRFIAAPCAAIVLALLGSSVFGQVDGTWAGSGGGSWNTASNWLNGDIADGGGTATFDDFRGRTGNATINLDSLRTLGEIRFDTNFSTAIANGTGGGIIVGPSGLVLNSVNSAVPRLEIGASVFPTANGISATISGTGDLIKTGQGQANLSGANSFAGTVRLNEGSLWVTGGNGSFGDLSNAIDFNGGSLGISTTALTTTRTVNVNAGGGGLRFFTGSFLNGLLTGSGTLMNEVGTVTFGGDITGFTGNYRNNGTTNFNGTTALGAGGFVENGATLNLNNATNNVSNRLGGRDLVSLGGNFAFTANAAADSFENAGNLILRNGATTMTLNAGTAGNANLSFTGLTRENRSTFFVRGNANLGADPTSAPNVPNLSFASSPGTLIGGDGSNGTNQAILPFGLATTGGLVTTGSTLSFVTWDSVSNRIVPLSTSTGYNTTLSGAAVDDNVSINAGGALSVDAGGQTVNSLRFGIGGVTLNGGAGDAINITSGAILSTAATTTINAPINFGNAEGIIFSSGATLINGPISGTNGLTKAGVGNLTLSDSNTYTGTTTINLGQLRVGSGTVTADGSAASAFGQGTNAIELHSSANTAGASNRIWTDGNFVLNRDLNVTLGGGNITGIGVVGGSANESFVLNGDLVLNASGDSVHRFLNLEKGAANAFQTGVTVNGQISGSGGLRSTNASYNILTGNNSYSGGTVIGGSSFTSGTGNSLQHVTDKWEIRNSNGLGTGVIQFIASTAAGQPVLGVGTLISEGASGNTINNDIELFSGYARFDGSQSLTINGNFSLNSLGLTNSVFNIQGAPVIVNGNIGRGAWMKMGSGRMVLNGNNTYSAPTTIRQGALEVSSIGNGGTVGNLGQAPAGANYLVFSSNAVGDYGTLRYTGAGEATDRLFSLQGTGGTIDASGTGALVFSNAGTIGNVADLTGVSGLTIVATAGVVSGFGTALTSRLVVGAEVTSSTSPGIIPAGTTITEVGENFIRLSNNLSNPEQLTLQTLNFTRPAGNRMLNLVGSNTDLNTVAAILNNASNRNVQINKSGAGTWQLTNANTYSGGTFVNEGHLVINNASGGSGTGTGNVTVASGATLAGAGIIVPATGNSVDIFGTVSPGNSVGTLTFGSEDVTTTVNLSGIYEFELAVAGIGNVAFDSGLSSPNLPHLNHDVLNVFGTLDLTGSTLNISSLVSTGFDVFQDYSWLIATSNGGTLIGLPTIGIFSGAEFSAAPVDNFFVGSANGNLYLNFQAIPEPSAATLLLISGMGLVMGRRRRRT